eukprot:2537538-Amphidinium_carterae.1
MILSHAGKPPNALCGDPKGSAPTLHMCRSKCSQESASATKSASTQTVLGVTLCAAPVMVQDLTSREVLPRRKEALGQDIHLRSGFTSTTGQDLHLHG